MSGTGRPPAGCAAACRMRPGGRMGSRRGGVRPPDAGPAGPLPLRDAGEPVPDAGQRRCPCRAALFGAVSRPVQGVEAVHAHPPQRFRLPAAGPVTDPGKCCPRGAGPESPGRRACARPDWRRRPRGRCNPRPIPTGCRVGRDRRAPVTGDAEDAAPGMVDAGPAAAGNSVRRMRPRVSIASGCVSPGHQPRMRTGSGYRGRRSRSGRPRCAGRTRRRAHCRRWSPAGPADLLPPALIQRLGNDHRAVHRQQRPALAGQPGGEALRGA